MKDMIEQTTDTPESRNALRLKALPMLLAVEIIEIYDGLGPEEMISHDDLEASMREKLGLEPSDVDILLYELINTQMMDWNWQYLTYDYGFQDFYARPDQQRASLMTFWGSRKILQAGQSFPNDHQCLSENLWDNEYVIPFKKYSESDHLSHHANGLDSESINAFYVAHLISHRCSG